VIEADADGAAPIAGAPTGWGDAAIAIGILMGVVLGLGWLVRGAPPSFDVAISAVLLRTCPGWLSTSAEFVGSLPVVIAIYVALGAITVMRPTGRSLLVVVAALAVEVPVEVLKVVFDRARPLAGQEIEAFGSTASFPSGHVVRLVVLGGLIVLLFFSGSNRSRLAATAVAGIVAGLVAVGRIGAGAHWPTDVLAGILVGVAWLIAITSWTAGVRVGRPH